MLVVAARNRVRRLFLRLKHCACTRFYGMDIDASARISWGARLDRTHPRGIHIGFESYVASGAIILSHDNPRGLKADTRIGARCFIGAGAIVLPGVSIDDHVVVGAGAIVTKDVPSGCVVAGNPARVLRQGIQTGRFGQII